MLRKVWEESDNWTVRSNVLVAWTLAATLLSTTNTEDVPRECNVIDLIQLDQNRRFRDKQ
jgi:hypothetical protein